MSADARSRLSPAYFASAAIVMAGTGRPEFAKPDSKLAVSVLSHAGVVGLPSSASSDASASENRESGYPAHVELREPTRYG
jgi:hypothetical protein